MTHHTLERVLSAGGAAVRLISAVRWERLLRQLCCLVGGVPIDLPAVGVAVARVVGCWGMEVSTLGTWCVSTLGTCCVMESVAVGGECVRW